jgi:phospholipid/cholesterol/gamma-HCH transport system permease protein
MLISLTAFFTGGVMALESYNTLLKFSLTNSVPTIVAFSIVTELGPVLSALMLNARSGSSITAEISSMIVTEQIDAMRTMNVDPVKYVVFPRFLSCFLGLPILVILGNIVGVFSGYFVSVYFLDIGRDVYISNTMMYLGVKELMMSFCKSVVFGFIVGISSCFFGMHSERAARGIGNATVQSVVFTSMLILISNYFITGAFLWWI